MIRKMLVLTVFGAAFALMTSATAYASVHSAGGATSHVVRDVAIGVVGVVAVVLAAMGATVSSSPRRFGAV